jgi:hypothetical protein
MSGEVFFKRLVERPLKANSMLRRQYKLTDENTSTFLGSYERTLEDDFFIGNIYLNAVYVHRLAIRRYAYLNLFLPVLMFLFLFLVHM